MLIKTKARCHHTPITAISKGEVIPSIGKDVGKPKPLYIAGWSIKYKYNQPPLWETVWLYLQNLNMYLRYDPEILLLSIYPRGMETYI